MQSWLDHSTRQTDGTALRAAAARATRWRVQAVNHAYLDTSIKDMARQLLCVDTFTMSLQRLDVFAEVPRPVLEARLAQLDARLARVHAEQNLGADAVSRVAPTHPLFADGTVAVEQTALIPCDLAGFPFEPEAW